MCLHAQAVHTTCRVRKGKAPSIAAMRKSMKWMLPMHVPAEQYHTCQVTRKKDIRHRHHVHAQRTTATTCQRQSTATIVLGLLQTYHCVKPDDAYNVLKAPLSDVSYVPSPITKFELLVNSSCSQLHTLSDSTIFLMAHHSPVTMVPGLPQGSSTIPARPPLPACMLATGARLARKSNNNTNQIQHSSLNYASTVAAASSSITVRISSVFFNQLTHDNRPRLSARLQHHTRQAALARMYAD
jgi:hypothetical protein